MREAVPSSVVSEVTDHVVLEGASDLARRTKGDKGSGPPGTGAVFDISSCYVGRFAARMCRRVTPDEAEGARVIPSINLD